MGSVEKYEWYHKRIFQKNATVKGLNWHFFIENKRAITIVSGHRKHKNFDLLTFEGYPNINDVEDRFVTAFKSYQGWFGGSSRKWVYYHEIIGLEVVEEDGTVIE